MNIGTSIATCMGKYATFSGRASRSEYWWFYLFNLLMTWGSIIVAASMFGIGNPSGDIFSNLISLIFLLPTLAVGSRRLHDIGKSGWWQLLIFTLIGIIPLIIWLASDTKAEGDKFDT